MGKYRKRIADDVLDLRLRSKGAVLIEGAKWCGKTTTAAQKAKSILYMQDPATLRHNLEMAEMDPGALLKGEPPRLIDEWQMAPELWDAVRFEVDMRGEFGQFMLTGSAVPANMSKIMHTGTGRIARMTMRPMSLFESGESSGEVSLGALFRGEKAVEGTDTTSLSDMAYYIARGGWPGIMGCDRDVALRQAVDYFDAVVSADISRVDDVERDAERTKQLLRSYARNVGSQVTLGAINSDMSPNEAYRLSDKTVGSYVKALRKIFVLEDSQAWNPNLRSRTAIRTARTRYFTDPSIACAALGVGPEDLLNDLNTMGLMFENLCVRDLRVYADALDGAVYHYRDRNGLECDAVMHLRNGSYGLIEIKLGGETLIEEGVCSLRKLADNIDTTRMKAPAFMMVLCAKAPYAYRRSDGVIIAPISCLKP